MQERTATSFYSHSLIGDKKEEEKSRSRTAQKHMWKMRDAC